MGVTFAVFQSSGIVPWSSDAWKIRVSAGANGCAISFRNLGDMESGPVALLGLMPLRSLRTPFSVTCI